MSGKSPVGLHEILSSKKFEVHAANSQSQGESSTRRKRSRLIFLPFYVKFKLKTNHKKLDLFFLRISLTAFVLADDIEKLSTEGKGKTPAKSEQVSSSI